MNPSLIFPLIFILLAVLVIYLDRKFAMIRDHGFGAPRPFSLSRTLAAWWFVIILGSVVSIFIVRGDLPLFYNSTFYLLSIIWATSIGAAIIDLNDQNNPNLTSLAQNMPGVNFWVDILSDKNSVNIYRLQTVVFNMVFGIWFVTVTFNNLMRNSSIDHIMPDFALNNLTLFGLASGVYLVSKSTENRQQTIQAAAPREPGPPPEL